ncbi:dipeptide ABC transporter ATP-binding protein [Paenibacillus sp. IB182496]|uniref:Dipeptide ABC transporter ATP-binding protein n=1 Tax=Paenibacillus sabuli TaxID=2772509 RepID=A0A927GRE2_9BACL|nr:dipeptide ABC transporter ATP-binding protein [Paenibacillus sabuli]MBD2845388.1 dipeptide ABC transporter ATP-binding protein [Paenibacillus sabuli]
MNTTTKTAAAAASQEAAPLLEISGLKKHYPIHSGWLRRQSGAVRALDGVDLAVSEGETLGIVGESGCGKSTMGQLITRLIEPTAGHLRFDGRDVTHVRGEELRRLRQHIQFIFQDPFASLNPRMRVFDVVAEPLIVHRVASGQALRREVAQLLEAVGLGEHQAQRFPHEFSGGQRQRIGIARALALRPRLIVCDEPVSALDVSIQAQILNLLKDLQAEYRLTYVFIAHGLPSVRHISDRIAVMYLGRVVEIADRDTLFEQPRHPYTAALLEAVPVDSPHERKPRTLLTGELPSPADPPPGCAFHPRCPRAQARCRIETPLLTEQPGGTYSACHYPLQEGDNA